MNTGYRVRAIFRLSPETSEDEAEVEYLFDLAFAPGREALSSYRLRENVPPVKNLCLVARDKYDVLAGAIRFWPISIGGVEHGSLLLGPVAVHPTRQGEGLGGLLLRVSLEKARRSAWHRVVLIGDAPYYQRFGFTNSTVLQFPPPSNPERILIRALREGAFDGVSGAVGKWQNPLT